MAYYSFIPPAEGFPRAAAAARRAIELDADVADAHVTMGIERLFWGWDRAAAERELRIATKLNPKLALAHSVLGLIVAIGGRHEEALKHVLHARELDPLSLFINVGVAWIHHFAGRPEDAIREALNAREIVPGFEEAGNVLISSYELLGRFEEAAAVVAQQRCWGLTLDGQALAEAFRQGGPPAYWRKRLELMDLVAADAPPVIHFAKAIVHYQLGQIDLAVQQLERMVEAHVGGCVFLGVDPHLSIMAGHPGYEEVLKAVGVAPVRTASAAHIGST
jgi:tetratricopeptide (TPR) repeat protein